MGTRIFKLFLLKPFPEVMAMPEEQMNELNAKDAQFKKDLGVRDLIMCGMWSDERYWGFGVQLFPDWKAVNEHLRCLNEVNWFQYFQADVLLGLDFEDHPNRLEPVKIKPSEDWIAQVWLMRTHPEFFDVGEDMMREVGKTMEQVYAMGVQELVSVYARPINERFESWGVNLIPSMEVQAEKTAIQQKIKWWKYVDAETYLGTAYSGELISKEGSEA